MSEYRINREFLVTESDVEQKVLYPLITTNEPIGLGFDKTEVHTKISLKKIEIDKGQKAILYYPDYIINVDGIPYIVVEAKKPGEDLNEAYRQASLYATEINRKFETGINPCQLIIASDGLELWAGTWDDAKPKFQIKNDYWYITDQEFNKFCERFSKSASGRAVEEIRKLIRKNKIFKKPLHLIGGKHIQGQLTENTFGETISIQYRHLFNPDAEEEITEIVHNAYVRVTKHESHISPIDKLIRKKILPATHNSIEIEDNTNPIALTTKLSQAHAYNNHVLLLIGSVGSGKSLFSRYLKEVALDKSVTSRLTWITINLNNAPVTSNEIYPWLKKKIVDQLQKVNEGIDFKSIEFIQNLYEEEIADLKRGTLSLLNPESDKYKELLVQNIMQYQADLDLTLQSYINKLVHKVNRDLVIVLDNCDKRNLEEQLLMFEVANWIKDSIKSIVFLPLRDTTYDHFKHEKPLDTVVKDLVFRINPPSLEKVIYSRIRYASRLSEKNGDKFYYLSNGMRVNYPSKDELFYLKSILRTLFQNNFFKRLIAGIAGRDIRIGLEVFLDFCKSGHIPDSDILKMKHTRGEHILPNHVISKVFLRGKRIYYTDSAARIKNLFYTEPSDKVPDPFVRVAILKWLNERARIKGISGIIGFHQAGLMISQLIVLGHEKNRIEAEISSLLRNRLIISETQKPEFISYEDLIAINISGVVHLELISNLEYLSACSEDVWFNVEELANEIARNISGEGAFSHFSLQTTLEHSKILIDYLEGYFKEFYSVYSEYLNETTFTLPIDFSIVKDIIENMGKNITFNKYREFKIGGVFPAKIVNIKPYGLIVEIDGSDQTGLVHVSKINDPDFENTFHYDDIINVKILEYRHEHNKYDLIIVEG